MAADRGDQAPRLERRGPKEVLPNWALSPTIAVGHRAARGSLWRLRVNANTLGRPMQRVVDAILGDVTCDDGRWTALVHHDSRPVRVHLMVDHGEDPASWIGLARSVVQRLSVLVPAALSVAGAELLELANEWRESDASPLFTAHDLSSMFKLRALLVFSGVSITPPDGHPG
jgi:hypothetical protein